MKVVYKKEASKCYFFGKKDQKLFFLLPPLLHITMQRSPMNKKLLSHSSSTGDAWFAFSTPCFQVWMSKQPNSGWAPYFRQCEILTIRLSFILIVVWVSNFQITYKYSSDIQITIWIMDKMSAIQMVVYQVMIWILEYIMIGLMSMI